MVVLTAADARFFHPLANLVGSIHFWAPGTPIVIFNLGLRPSQLAAISRWRNCEVRWPSGPPTLLMVDGQLRRCTHMRRIKLYAWKPVAILEGCDTFGKVLWLDAGSDLRGSLAPIDSLLSEHGHFLVQGQDLDMTMKLHHRCARRLGFDIANFIGKPSYSGNTQGYLRDSHAARNILLPMFAAACHKAIIAPFLSSLRNHRYDQSILSLLAHSQDPPPPPQTHLLSAHREELSPDPLQPSARRIYTARGSSQEYTRFLQTI